MKVNNTSVRISIFTTVNMLKLNEICAYPVYVHFAALINSHKSGDQIPSPTS